MNNRLLGLEEQLKKTPTAHPPQHRVKDHPQQSPHPTQHPPVVKKDSQVQSLRRRVRAMGGQVNYTVPGIVAAVAQDKNMACWAAATTMLMSWRAQQSFSILDAMRSLGPKYEQIYLSNSGLYDRDAPGLAAAAGFEVEPPMNFTVEGWEQLLRAYGPFFVFTAFPNMSIHGRVVKGISGDGTPTGTRFSIVDPDGGREYTETVAAFVGSYEREARETNFPLRMQVFHWPAGTRPGSMSTRYGYGASYNRYAAPFQQAAATFTAQAVTRMRDFFVQNATGGSPQSCIGTMNEGLRRLFDNPSIPVGSEVHTTMEALRQAGHATSRQDIEFKDAGGNTTRGERPPESLSESLLARMQAMNGGAAGWSIFGLSLMDGYHSVLLSLDSTNPAQPAIYWSDQWPSNGGWLSLDGAGLDARVTTLTRQWYPEFIAERERRTGKRVAPRTRATLWMVLP
jgi:hypothetical protein